MEVTEKMKPYPAYKPSGVEWIGEIPERWDVKKLKMVLTEKLKYGANESAELDDENLPRYIRITDFDDMGKLRTETFRSLPYDTAKEYLLKNGDVLFARSGATVGKTFQFKNYDGEACFAGYLIKATVDEEIIFSDYLYYYTKSNSYENWKDSIFIQATIQNISADKYSILDLPIPPNSEQQSIIAFLDRKTHQIDILIEKEQNKIELLKEQRSAVINQAVTKGLDPDVQMKDSGIEWLGEIPEHWNIIKLKRATQFIYGDSLSNENRSNGNIPVYGSNGITGYHNEAITKSPCIIIGRKGSFGKINYSHVNCFPIDTTFYIDSTATHNNLRWLYYVLITLRLDAFSKDSAVPGLSREESYEKTILLPLYSEQQSIAAFLDRKTSQIDILIEKKHRQIGLFKKYRTALISEAVTGKIDVRHQ